MTFKGRDVFGGVVAGAVLGAILTDAITRRHPDALGYIIGPAGILPLLVSAATALLLFIGARHAARVLQHNARAELATRFQKAAELTANPTDIARVAGFSLFREIVAEDSARYGAAALETMVEAIESASREMAIGVDLWENDNNKPMPDIATLSPPAVSSAISMLAKVFPNSNWPATSNIVLNNMLLISAAHISGISLIHESFRRIQFMKLAMNNVTFTECDFRDTAISARVLLNVTFVRCNLAGANFEFARPGPVAIRPDQIGILRFIDCTDIEGATMNRRPLAEWIANAE